MDARDIDPVEEIRSELIDVMRTRADEVADRLVARFNRADLGPNFDIAWFRSIAPEAVRAMVTLLEETEHHWDGTLPPAAAAQIQSAARQGASLENILRAFAIAGTVFFEFFAERITSLPQALEALRYATSWQSRNYHRLLNAFVAEYTKEVERLNRDPSRRVK